MSSLAKSQNYKTANQAHTIFSTCGTNFVKSSWVKKYVLNYFHLVRKRCRSKWGSLLSSLGLCPSEWKPTLENQTSKFWKRWPPGPHSWFLLLDHQPCDPGDWGQHLLRCCQRGWTRTACLHHLEVFGKISVLIWNCVCVSNCGLSVCSLITSFNYSTEIARKPSSFYLVFPDGTFMFVTEPSQVMCCPSKVWAWSSSCKEIQIHSCCNSFWRQWISGMWTFWKIDIFAKVGKSSKM